MTAAYPAVRLDITPGIARVNEAHLAYSAPDIACIEIDMRSKYAVMGGACCGGDTVPEVYIGADERTLHKNDAAAGLTQVAFPDYAGWDVFATDCARYTCRVVLVRRRES